MRILTFNNWVNKNNSYQLPVPNKTTIYDDKSLDKFVLPKDMPEHSEKEPNTDKNYNNEYIYTDSAASLDTANGSEEKNIATIDQYSANGEEDMSDFGKIKGINI